MRHLDPLVRQAPFAGELLTGYLHRIVSRTSVVDQDIVMSYVGKKPFRVVREVQLNLIEVMDELL